MPPMIPPPVTPAATSPVAQGGARGRSADEAQGRAFGAALERSRTSQAEKASDADTVVADAKPLRKTELAEEMRDAQPAEPDLAFLAAAVTPQQALVLAGGATTQGSSAPETSLAPVTPDAQAGLPAGTVRLSSDAAAAPAPAIAIDDASAPTATAAAQSAAPEADNAAPPSLYEIVRAAVAAQPMAVDGKKPAAAPAGPPVGTAAPGRAGAPRTVSATTTEQLAAAAQAQPAGDAKPATADVAPVAAVSAGTSADDTAAPSTAPFALQQPTTVSTERTTESPAARPAVHTLAPEVGSEKWAPALGQQLARMSLGGTHTAELNLNPAGLGPLKVTLSVGEHQAQAAFVSAHESVRKAVEAALPQLRTSLSEQGITLGQTSVGADTRAPFGQDAAFAQQQKQQQRQGAWRPQGTSAAADIARTATAAPRPVATPRTGPGIDTFA